MMVEDDLPASQFEMERLTYRWYVDYDRHTDYEKNPDWTNDIKSSSYVKTPDDGPAKKVHTFEDRFDPEHVWIKSDTVHKLTNTL